MECDKLSITIVIRKDEHPDLYEFVEELKVKKYRISAVFRELLDEDCRTRGWDCVKIERADDETTETD